MYSAGLKPGWDKMQLCMSSVCHFEVTHRGFGDSYQCLNVELTAKLFSGHDDDVDVIFGL